MRCIFSKAVAMQSLHRFPQKVSRVFVSIKFCGNAFDEAMQPPRIASSLTMLSAVSAQ